MTTRHQENDKHILQIENKTGLHEMYHRVLNNNQFYIYISFVFYLEHVRDPTL